MSSRLSTGAKKVNNLNMFCVSPEWQQQQIERRSLFKYLNNVLYSFTLFRWLKIIINSVFSFRLKLGVRVTV